jgi:hypothetical protein
MKNTRQDLDARLDALAASVPRMLEGSSGDSEKGVFDRIIEEIKQAAGPEDTDHVWSRLQCILRDNGLIPGDDEPCNDGEARPDDGAVIQ